MYIYPSSKDGNRLAHVDEVEPINLFHTWAGSQSTYTGVFNPFLLSMKRWIEEAIHERIQMAELFLFMEVEFMMCFYKCSATMYFSVCLSTLLMSYWCFVAFQSSIGRRCLGKFQGMIIVIPGCSPKPAITDARPWQINKM
jgi:hypothetical protein